MRYFRFDRLTEDMAHWHAQQATLATGIPHVAVPAHCEEDGCCWPDCWKVQRKDAGCSSLP